MNKKRPSEEHQVESENQTGGLTAHSVKFVDNVGAGVHIDTVQNLTVYNSRGQSRADFQIADEGPAADVTMVDVFPQQLFATGSPATISGSSNVSAVTAYTHVKSSEIELEFFNPIAEEDMSISASTATPRFTITHMEPNRMRLQFNGPIPVRLGVRIDTKPKKK